VFYGLNTGTLEAIGDANGVDSAIKEGFTLFEKGTGKDWEMLGRGWSGEERGRRTDNTSGSVTNLVVLALGELYEELCDLVLDFHLAEDCGTIVCDGDIAVG